MAKAREDIQFRGHRIIANKTGAMIYPDKHGLKAESTEEALDAARTWINDKYTDRADIRREPHIGTVEDYVEALSVINPTAGKRRMLVAHRGAEELRMTAAQLSEAAGWKSQSSANLHYGTLGKAVADQGDLKLTGSDKKAQTAALAQYHEDSSEWEMYPEVAEAMDRLNLK